VPKVVEADADPKQETDATSFGDVVFWSRKEIEKPVLYGSTIFSEQYWVYGVLCGYDRENAVSGVEVLDDVEKIFIELYKGVDVSEALSKSAVRVRRKDRVKALRGLEVRG
jgi:hypothetical protein